MAESRTSPVLRDQWSADPDRDPRDRERRRGRGSGRDRGRNRGRDRGRPYRPNNRNFDRPGRSPPRASRFGPDSSHDFGDFAPDRSPRRGSPPPPNFHNGRRLDPTQTVSSAGNWNAHPSAPFDREAPGLEASHHIAAVAISPRRVQTTRITVKDRTEALHSRNEVAAPKVVVLPGEDHHAGAGTVEEKTVVVQKSHVLEDPGHQLMNEGFILRLIDGLVPLVVTITATTDLTIDRTHGTPSRRNSAMNTTRPIQSVVDGAGRSPSPPRPIPSFDSDNFGSTGENSTHAQDGFPMHSMRSDVNNQPRRRPSRPRLDSRPYANPQNQTSTGSYHGSPQPPSPYSAGRGGWSGPPSYSGPGHTSPYRHDDYSSHNGNYYHNQGQSNGPGNHHPQSPYGGPPTEVATLVAVLEETFQTRVPIGDFLALVLIHITMDPHNAAREDISTTCNGPHRDHEAVGDNIAPARHIVMDHKLLIDHSLTMTHNPPELARVIVISGHPIGMKRKTRPNLNPLAETSNLCHPRPTNPMKRHQQTRAGSSALLSSQRLHLLPLQSRYLTLPRGCRSASRPPRAPEPPQQPRNRFTNGPLPKFKPESRADRRDRGGRNRDRDRRDFREPREFRDPRDRRDDRRFDQRRDRRQGEWPSDRPSDWQDRRRDPSLEPPRQAPPPKQKRILTRPKPRPTLPEEFANAESVYYRKPGNESVIGAGTYGKVFKGIHVYTQRKVALKKIRMEGEKDGFPVTAVREIKLLQHLRNHNVVSLLEVMVEKNECFMVFEYLSHDLTGLINHPTFSLTLSHKKDLAKQMFEGLNYLHHRGVLHRDIKAANILISNRGLLKFADFGLARFFSKSRQLDYTNRVITIWYRPPELLLGETRYGPAVDMWSAACVCMEMFTKKAVFPGEGGELSQMDKIYNALGTPTKTEWPDLVEMPWFHLMRPTERRKRVFEDVYRDVLTTSAMDLISSIFRYDPSQRPSAEDVLKHPYFVSEEPAPHPPIELEHVEGDWHEFESKALRKEARRVEYQNQKDRDKRKADASVPSSDRDSKRTKQDSSDRVSAQ
ncbi:uncharacterized protein N7500_007330 [Penicillium coprophilum]|uniref:uncharacterized protein n=1 Tax=Penicillium coprophilum TaxID=36646 RepID=UPI002394DF6A|nr:uncharacterized protein N7500_007330 [Penicillium coprophilum]KAJ5165500.1 hypothetical protein N7500_007330 [Penicillium coprophilum]